MTWELSEDGTYFTTTAKVFVNPPAEGGEGWKYLGIAMEAPQTGNLPALAELVDTELSEEWTATYSSSGAFNSSGGTLQAWVEPDIIDKIDDALTSPERCPHCRRDWHPGPLTDNVRKMLANHRFDLNYDPTLDDSPIVCVGAEYHGPNRPNTIDSWGVSSPTWTVVVGGKEPSYVKMALDHVTEMKKSLTEMLVWPKWEPTWTFYDEAWSMIATSKPQPCDLPDELPQVEFGPQNWIPPQEPVNPPATLSKAVWAYWNDFNKQEIPVPDSPGLDFSQYQTDEISYPTSGKKAWK